MTQDASDILIILFFVMAFVALAKKVFSFGVYIVKAIAVYATLRNQNRNNSGLAFLPFVQDYLEADAIMTYQGVEDGKKRICKIVFLVNALSSVILIGVNFMSTLIGNAFDISYSEMGNDIEASIETILNDIYESGFTVEHVTQILEANPILLFAVGLFALFAALAVYVFIARCKMLTYAGYGIFAAFLIVLFISPFYLFFVNSKMNNMGNYRRRDYEIVEPYNFR